MAETIKLELSLEAREIIADLSKPAAWVSRAMKRGMDAANQVTVGHIQSAHLTGTGPFPVDQHRLGVRTNRLRGAVRATPAEIDGERVESAIGDSVKYAAVHEFGLKVHVGERTGTVRLRLNKNGELMRQAGYGHLAVFGSRRHRRVKEVGYVAAAHDIQMPERAPFRTGIRERLQRTGAEISALIVEAWKQRKS